jgi:hypothetical protein
VWWFLPRLCCAFSKPWPCRACSLNTPTSLASPAPPLLDTMHTDALSFSAHKPHGHRLPHTLQLCTSPVLCAHASLLSSNNRCTPHRHSVRPCDSCPMTVLHAIAPAIPSCHMRTLPAVAPQLHACLQPMQYTAATADGFWSSTGQS